MSTRYKTIPGKYLPWVSRQISSVCALAERTDQTVHYGQVYVFSAARNKVLDRCGVPVNLHKEVTHYPENRDNSILLEQEAAEGTVLIGVFNAFSRRDISFVEWKSRDEKEVLQAFLIGEDSWLLAYHSEAPGGRFEKAFTNAYTEARACAVEIPRDLAVREKQTWDALVQRTWRHTFQANGALI